MRVYQASPLSKIAKPSWLDALLRQRQVSQGEAASKRNARLYPAFSSMLNATDDLNVFLKLGEAYAPLRETVLQAKPDSAKLFLNGYYNLFYAAVAKRLRGEPRKRQILRDAPPREWDIDSLFVLVCELGSLAQVKTFVEKTRLGSKGHVAALRSAFYAACSNDKPGTARWLAEHFEFALARGLISVPLVSSARTNDTDSLRWFQATYAPDLTTKEAREDLLALCEGRPFSSAEEERKGVETAEWLINTFAITPQAFRFHAMSRGCPGYSYTERAIRGAWRKGSIPLVELIFRRYPVDGYVGWWDVNNELGTYPPNVVRWLIENLPEKFEEEAKVKAFRAACAKGETDLAHWLADFLHLSVENFLQGFRVACEAGHIDIASWLIGDRVAELAYDVESLYEILENSTSDQGLVWLANSLPLRQLLSDPERLGNALYNALAGAAPDVVRFICEKLAWSASASTQAIKRYLLQDVSAVSISDLQKTGAQEKELRALRFAATCFTLNREVLTNSQLLNLAFRALYGDTSFNDWIIATFGLGKEFFASPLIESSISATKFDYALWYYLKFKEMLNFQEP